MKKYLIIFLCVFFMMGCNSKSSFNNKKLAGKYSIEIALPEDDKSELGDMTTYTLSRCFLDNADIDRLAELILEQTNCQNNQNN